MTKQRKAILSCLGVGLMSLAMGFGVISFEASATTTAKFEMEEGAMVRIAKNAEDATGIRWQASFNEAYWNTLSTEGKTVEFGAIVAPAENVDASVGLTETTSEMIEVPCSATEPKFDENGVFTYYASIVYDELDETLKEKAYAVELTARAYIKIGGKYNFVDEYQTTRSMRSVALAAVQSGECTAEQLGNYYGWSAEQNNVTDEDDNTGYYSIVDGTGSFTNPNNLIDSSINQAYLGAAPVDVEITQDGLTISGVSASLEAGKEYRLNVFAKDGNIYTQPFIAATKVIDEVSDLSYFTMTNIELGTIELGTTENKIPYATTGTTVFDGYYVLTKNIDATGYSHEVTDRTKGDATTYTGQAGNSSVRSKLDKLSKTGSGWYVTNYAPSQTGGLTGTFDGNGYTISNLTVAHHGLFGLIVGGTVKNLGLVNAALGAEKTTYEDRVLFAEQMVNATIENVYLQMANDTVRGPKAALAMTTAGTITMKNCVFDYNIYAAGGADVTTTTNPWAYGLFGATTSQTMSYADTTFACSDVYVRTNVAISVTLENKYNYNTSVAIAENDAENTSTAIEDAAFALIGGTVENGVLMRNGANFDTANNKYIFNTWSGGAHIRRIEGMYRYDTALDMEKANNSYSTFDTDMWIYGDGKIAFKSTGKSLANTVEGTYYLDATKGTFTSEDMKKMFGAESAKITSAELNGTALTVENGAITTGFEDVSAHGTAVNLTVKIEGKVLPYSVSVIPATRLIQTTADLAEVFNITNIILNKQSATEGTTEFNGYYVLAGDINAQGYTHKVTNGGTLTDDLTWTDKNGGAYSKLEYINNNGDYALGYVRGGIATDGGLTGTFDGNGHTISNLTVQGHGLFGLIVGGTIKNVGFTGVTMTTSKSHEDSALFAAQMVDATLQNVYVQANDITGHANSNKGLLSVSAFGTNNLKNCVFDYDFDTREARKVTYGLVASIDNNSKLGTVKGENVYVVSNSALCVRALNVLKNDTQIALGANETTNQDELRFKLLGGVITDNGDGTYSYTLNNSAFTPVNDTSIMGTNHYWVSGFSGIKRYDTAGLMEQAGNSYTSFSDSYWTVTDGVLSWNA